MTGLKWLCWLIPFCSGLMMPLSLSMAEENLSVELSSDHFVQGDTVIVRVKSIAQVEAQYLIFQEKKLPLYPDEEGYQGLIGIPGDMKDGEYPVEVGGTDHKGVQVTRKLTVKVEKGDFLSEEITLPKTKSKLPNSPRAQEETRMIRKLVLKETHHRYWKDFFSRPSSGQISSPYGLRRVLIAPEGKIPWGFHAGIDFQGKMGDEILAPEAGEVLFTGTLSLYGKTLIIDHGQGVVSVYYHLSDYFVAKGDVCRKGQKIGAMGSTGLSTGPHLHWGIYVHGERVNPLKWLGPTENAAPSQKK